MEFATWSPRMLSVLRIMTGLLFLEHGTQKSRFAFREPRPRPDSTARLSKAYSNWLAAILIVIGLFTRPVAFILAGDMAVAYF